jgi:hypothetical protein
VKRKWVLMTEETLIGVETETLPGDIEIIPVADSEAETADQERCIKLHALTVE